MHEKLSVKVSHQQTQYRVKYPTVKDSATLAH